MGLAREVQDALYERLRWLEDDGYRWFKSYADFRKARVGTVSYIGTSVTSHGAAARSIGVSFGVRNDAVERLWQRLDSESGPLTHYARTVGNYSPNVGPGPHTLFHPVWASWSVTSPGEIGGAVGDEIDCFVTDFAVPYLSSVEEPLAMRDAVLARPELTTRGVWRPVLGVDALHEPDRIDDDVVRLEGLVAGKVARIQERFRADVRRLRTHLADGDV